MKAITVNILHKNPGQQQEHVCEHESFANYAGTGKQAYWTNGPCYFHIAVLTAWIPDKWGHHQTMLSQSKTHVQQGWRGEGRW